MSNSYEKTQFHRDIAEIKPEDIEYYIAHGRRLRARMAGEIMHKGITGFAHIIAYPFRLFRSDTGRAHSLPLTRNELHSQQS